MNTKFFSISNLKGVSLLLVAAAMSISVYAQPTMVNHVGDSVKHRQSYLVDRAEAENLQFNQEFVQQGSGWTTSPNGTRIQATSTYELTRYVKQGDAVPLYLTTSQNDGQRTGHRGYQRWYNYDTEEALVPGVTWDNRNGQNNTPNHVNEFNAVYQYKNGLVMSAYFTAQGNGGNNNGFAGFNFWAILPNGQERLNVGADLSSYTDYECTAGRAAAPGNSNFREPTLDLRHI